jgi:NADPH:quinone reductase-like Zn-dependent oxidoreductase
LTTSESPFQNIHYKSEELTFSNRIAGIFPSLLNKMPHTAGADYAGEIIEVEHPTTSSIGLDADPPWLQEGAKVYGILPADSAFKNGRGTLATYAVAQNAEMGEIPDGMSIEDAAGITLVGLTAATLAAKVKANDRVLVLGGTTAVGLLLIQMCLVEKASFIVATCSSSKSSAVTKAGAHEFIDYKQNAGIPQLKEKYSSKTFDLVLDCVGSFETFNACPAFLKKDGTYFNIGASSLDLSNLRGSVGSFVKNTMQTMLRPAMLGGTPRKYVTTGLDKKLIKQLREYIDSGKVKPLTDKVFEFDEAPKAYEYLIGGRATGKVVVKVP